VFFIKVLSDYNSNKPKDEQHGINCRFRDYTVIKLTISKTIYKVKVRFTISDSYSILNNKLDSDFEVYTQKGVFPYKFSKTPDLFYVGTIPYISYYNSISRKNYNSMFSSM